MAYLFVRAEQTPVRPSPQSLLWFVPILLAVHLVSRLVSPEQTTSVAKIGVLQMETVAWVVSFLLLHRILSALLLAEIVPLLGRYTLLAYIGRMLFMVVLSRFAVTYVGPHGARATYFALLVAATVATCFLVIGFDRFRKRWGWFDWGYRVVFAGVPSG